MIKLNVLIALFCLLFSQVVAQDDPTILLGSGGGVTGVATVYQITPKGEVFKGKGVGVVKYTECAKIRRAKAKKMIAKVAAAVSSINFDHPGNLYYFLTLKENDGEKKITWGDADHKVPDNVKLLFDEAQASVAELKYKPIPETK